jgi:hypothetical protein
MHVATGRDESCGFSAWVCAYGRVHERSLCAEVASLRTAVDDVKERDTHLAHAQDEVPHCSPRLGPVVVTVRPESCYGLRRGQVCRLAQEVERWEREARAKDEAIEAMRTSQLLAHSHQVHHRPTPHPANPTQTHRLSSC